MSLKSNPCRKARRPVAPFFLSFPKGICFFSLYALKRKAPVSNRNRSPWVFVFATVVAMLFAAAILPHTNALPSVHAFSKQTREAGAAVFHDKGCEHCHGVDGIGTDRGPDLSSIGKRWKRDRIERQIREGGGGMPPFGDALQPDEVRSMVDFLSARRKAPKLVEPPAAIKPPSIETGL